MPSYLEVFRRGLIVHLNAVAEYHERIADEQVSDVPRQRGINTSRQHRAFHLRVH